MALVRLNKKFCSIVVTTILLLMTEHSVAVPTLSDIALSVPENSTNYSIDPFEGTRPAEYSIVGASVSGDGSVSIDGATQTLNYTPDLNFAGTETIYFIVLDSADQDTATAEITVTVPDNQSPVAVDDAYTLTEDDPSTSLRVIADNDTDTEEDTLTLVSISALDNGGTATISGQDILYQPAANFSGTETFTYQISDGINPNVSAQVTVTVTAVNDTPVANDDSFSIAEDASETLYDVLSNDTDADTADSLTITAVTAPSANGVATISNNQISYQPDSNFYGTETFDYTISDGTEDTTATVTFTITSVNDLPTVVDDSITVDENSSTTTINVINNDSDPDNGDSDPLVDDTLTILAVSTPNKGVVQISPDSLSLSYTPNADETGQDSFTYVLSDGKGGTTTGEVTVTITPLNNLPVANADVATVLEDSGTTLIDVLSNDTDADASDTLSITSLSATSNSGGISISNGQIAYTPAANFNGVETFVYTLSDGAATDTATVTVTVTPVNDDPVATDDSASVAEDSASTSIDVLANDVDADGDTLTVAITTAPQNGSASVNGSNQVVYQPTADYSGVDYLTYTITDGTSADSATVVINISSTNDIPIAVDDSNANLILANAILEDSAPLILDVLANDSDADPTDTLTITSITAPTDGGLATISNDRILYQPAANFFGSESFDYTISDGTTTDTATVTLAITSVNDDPVAVDDSATVIEDSADNVIDVLSNDSDGDGDTLSISITTSPSEGTASLNDSGAIVYTPDADYSGVDSLSYTISDGSNIDTGTLVINVTATNDPPVAVNDSTTLNEDAQAVQIDVLDNDSDSENNTLTIVAVTNPSQGGSASTDGANVTYQPATNFYGAETFEYTISDGIATTTASISITVNPVNDLPLAANDTASVDEDSANNVIDVLTNDSDVDGDSIVINAVSESNQNGTVSIGLDENLRTVLIYTPASNFAGTDTIDYIVSDTNGGIDAATLTVVVSNANDAPVAVADTNATLGVTIAEDSAGVTLDVLSNDSDPDSDSLSLTAVSAPSNGGSASINNGNITYEPASNFNGSETFTYTISDGSLTSTAVVTLSVSSVNDSPTVSPDSVTVAKNSGATTIDVLANDSDTVEGDVLTLNSVSTSGLGSVSVADNKVIYTPGTDYVGNETLTYVVSDGHGSTVTGNVDVQVIGTTGTCDTNSISISSIATDCSINPQGLKTTIYAFGFCTAAPTRPTTSSTYDLSNCSLMYQSNTGQEVTFGASGTSFAFNDFVEPAQQTYTYGIIIFSSDISVKGALELQNETCITSSTSSNRISCSAAYSATDAEFALTPLKYFFTTTTFSYQFSNDSVTLDLIDSSTQKLATFSGDEVTGTGTANQVFAVQSLSSPVEFSDTTNLIDIGFRISTGIALDATAPDGQTGYADSSPFSMRFSVQ